MSQYSNHCIRCFLEHPQHRLIRGEIPKAINSFTILNKSSSLVFESTNFSKIIIKICFPLLFVALISNPFIVTKNWMIFSKSGFWWWFVVRGIKKWQSFLLLLLIFIPASMRTLIKPKKLLFSHSKLELRAKSGFHPDSLVLFTMMPFWIRNSTSFNNLGPRWRKQTTERAFHMFLPLWFNSTRLVCSRSLTWLKMW